MRTPKITPAALLVLFWLMTISAFCQSFSTWHNSLWWDGANVTANGIGRFTNAAGGTVVFFNPSGGPSAIDLQSQGNTDFVLINSPGTGLQLGPLGNLSTIDAAGNFIASSFTGVGANLTALNATQLTSGTVPAARLTGVDGSGLTNLNLSDGGKVTSGIQQWGSSTGGGNPTATHKYIIVNDSPTGYANGGDNQVTVVNYSTNGTSSGTGIGDAVMGGDDGTGKASILTAAGGPILICEPTNRYESLDPGDNYIVQNTSVPSVKGFGISSPSYGGGVTSDTWNYYGLFVDLEHSLFRIPLININASGLNQPDSVMYAITVSGVSVVPATFNNPPAVLAIYSNNAHWFSSYSNNISAGSGTWYVSGSFGPPAASGTFTKIQGTGDATISFSASSVFRSYAGDAMTVTPAGNMGVFSNIVTTNGTFFTKVAPSGVNNVNRFATAQTITFNAGPNSSGFLVQDNGAVETVNGGTRGSYIFSGNSGAASDLWDGTPTFTVGGNELQNFNNTGYSTVDSHGSVGWKLTNSAANYNLARQDGTVLLNGSGTITATLPDAALANNPSKGRLYAVKNTGTTNSAIATTSSQTIDGKTSTTNAPKETLLLQSDGANWQIIASYGGAPTNFFAVSTSGFTNTTPWEEVAYVTGTAVTLTNVLSNGQPYMTNTTLVNAVLTIDMMPGDSFVSGVAAGLGGTVRALKR